MRYDYMLIWGHGLPFRDDILRIIKGCPVLQIVMILHHTPSSAGDLVKAVYSCDYAPIEHLKGKTRYLEHTPAQVVFVFFENLQPEEDYFGEGPFRHIESVTIRALKEVIRNTFNPRYGDKRSEEHVIHASDNEYQTDHILRYLGYPGVKMFRKVHLALNAPYHMERITSFTVCQVPLLSLYCRIMTESGEPELTPVEDTPHYEALLGKTAKYERYIERFIGTMLTDDHSLEKLLEMKTSFSYLAPPHETDYIIAIPAGGTDLAVLDGLHRAAVLRYQGFENAVVAVIRVNQS